MATQHGNNLTSIKEKNRALALQLIATGQAVSRVELARKMLLTKTTLGNIVSELIAKGIVSESRLPEAEVEAETALGRRPITLDLAPTSPLIAGMLIKRNILSVILADLKGVVVDQADYEYETIDAQSLTDRLLYLYDQLSDRQSRPIVAIGISSPGPVDTTRQMIMAPINFWGIRNLPISSIIQEKTGLPIVTEIMDLSHLPLFENVDVIQVGARNMQNFELLKALGHTDKPILLKRGLSSTIQELLMSAEYIMAGGNERVMLCERGIRTFETATRNTLDLSCIPVLKSLTHLPVIIDPSHATGVAKLVPPMAMAAVAAGADGLIIEVHNDPPHAACDGQQSLTPQAFDELVQGIEKLRPYAYRY